MSAKQLQLTSTVTMVLFVRTTLNPMALVFLIQFNICSLDYDVNEKVNMYQMNVLIQMIYMVYTA